MLSLLYEVELPQTDFTSLLILLLLFFLFLSGWPLQKNPKAPSFQIRLGWNLAGLFFK